MARALATAPGLDDESPVWIVAATIAVFDIVGLQKS
jgi:hypothetical protein